MDYRHIERAMGYLSFGIATVLQTQRDPKLCYCSENWQIHGISHGKLVNQTKPPNEAYLRNEKWPKCS